MSKVAVVTGGGSGLGLSICQHLARQDRAVAVLDMDGEAAERVVGDLRAEGAQAIAVEVDVSDQSMRRSTRFAPSWGLSRSW